MLGVHLNLLIGPTVPVPAPPNLLASVQRVEVRASATRPSGFSLTFTVGPSRLGLPAFGFDDDPLLSRGNRVVVTALLRGMPHVLMDGLILESELTPGLGAGDGTCTIRGRDVGIVLDLEERSEEYPAQADHVVATMILGRAEYAQYGLLPSVIPAATLDQPLPSERVPTQQGTDLTHLNRLARRNGHVFYLTPGPAPGMNTAYWGPPVRSGPPQRSLAVRMGSFTNVDSFDVVTAEQSALMVTGEIKDRLTGQDVPIMSSPVPARAPLASVPLASRDPALVRKRTLRDPGLTAVQALARAQAASDSAADGAVRATGSLDPLRYGSVLQPRALVDVRGVGTRHAGTWLVETVTHVLSPGRYQQQFTLQRDGELPLAPAVVP